MTNKDQQSGEYAVSGNALRVDREPIPSEPTYVFGTDLTGQHKTETGSVAVSLHQAAVGKGSGASGNAYAIPYRNSTGELLAASVIGNYVESLCHSAAQNPHKLFHVSRFACEHGAHDDQTVAALFALAPDNCQLPGLWRHLLNPAEPARVLLFDSGAHLKKSAWQKHLHNFLDLNVPLWNVPSVELVSVGHARTIVANDMAAKYLQLKHRIIGPNEAYYGREAQVAAEAKAVWYATHVISLLDFDMTAEPQQIRIMNAATRGGLMIDQLDATLFD